MSELSDNQNPTNEERRTLMLLGRRCRPTRIQRKRVRGWKMPPNTIYIGRPTKWGNPFTLTQRGGDRPSCVDAYREWLRETLKLDPHFLDALRGRNVACWCRLDVDCHGDILLQMANKGGNVA